MVLSNANAKFENKFMFGGTMTQTRPFCGWKPLG
jgi:hypothetical protein